MCEELPSSPYPDPEGPRHQDRKKVFPSLAYEDPQVAASAAYSVDESGPRGSLTKLLTVPDQRMMSRWKQTLDDAAFGAFERMDELAMADSCLHRFHHGTDGVEPWSASTSPTFAENCVLESDVLSKYNVDGR